MNTEFNNIIQRLQTNDKIRVEIKQHPMGTVIVSKTDCIDCKKMTEESGSVEEWFTALQNKGVGKIQIQLFKKHGNTCVREGLAYNCELGGEEKKETMETPKQLPQTPATVQQFGLGMPGLSMPDMINLNVDSRMLQTTKHDLQLEKEKTVRLQKENRELEDKVRVLENGASTKEFWGSMLKEAAPALQGIVTAFAAPGLAAPAAPQATPNLPEGIKGALIKYIWDSGQELDDNKITATYYILNTLAKNDPNFIKDIQELLEKHNLITHGTNDNDNSN